MKDIKVFHTGDLHIGSGRRLHDYLARTSGVCTSILDIVIADKTPNKILVVAGDLMHGSAPTEPERIIALEFVTKAIRAKIHLVMINGNHDHITEDGVTMIDCFQVISSLASKYLHVITVNPGVVDIDIGTGPGVSGVSFVCIPCKQDLTTKKLKNLLVANAKKAKHKIIYGVAHDAINGSIANDNHTMKTDCDIPDVPEIRGIMLGDIHKTQRVGRGAWYCGSPYQTRFEEDSHKGILVWDPDKEDPELVLIKGTPKLIKITDPKKLEKYKNTKHTVRYVGKDPVFGIDEPNISLLPNLKVIEEAGTISTVVEKTNHSALLGLRKFLKKEGLSADDIEKGYSEVDMELRR